MEDSRKAFDVLFVADMTRGGDIALRIRRELQALAGRGYRCALRHLPAGSDREISPDIRRSVREGLAEPIVPGARAEAKLALVFSPGMVQAPPDLGGLSAGQVILVVDSPPSPKQMGRWFGFAIGPMAWVPTNRWMRAGLRDLGTPVPVLEEDWRAIAVPCRPRGDDAPRRLHPVIGRVGTSAASEWPDTAEDLDAAYAGAGGFDVWMLGGPPREVKAQSRLARSWTILEGGDIAVERFVEAIDALVHVPSETAWTFPEAAIVGCMASGKPVILPPRFRPHFGEAAIYAEPAEAMAAAARILSDDTARSALGEAAAARCGRTNSEAAYLDRIAALIGPPAPAARPRPPAPVDAPVRRVLFVPSAGVGLGHAARLLAIARRLDDRLEPVFASLGQAGDVFDAFGYRSDYIPSPADTRTDAADWDPWFRHDLGEIIERYDPAVVVFDGNNPTPGLVHAVLAHGACRLVWVRRGMGPETPSRHLDNARFFDGIIEPGEIAGERDRGPTARRRHEVARVAPIRLLDDDEILDRAAARRDLGLDPDRPAVLIQPGSGANRDIVDLTDRLVTQLRRFDGLQIVVAEWSNGAITLPHWPGTRRLRGFPISRWFAAFDFSVSAAGYNTFHEVIAHGLPTIFVANRHPSMDDQGARAEYAQDHGAGFDLKEEEMHLFPTLCRAMLAPEANAVVRAGCAGFDRTNGAVEAAAIIGRLAGVGA